MRSATALVVAAIVLVAGALVAPATVASAAGSEPRPTGGGRCPKGASDAVIDAYSTLFSRATSFTPEDRAERLADGDDPAVRALLDTWLADPAGTASTVTVNEVRCRTRARAVVDADLNLAGNPFPGVLPRGRAELDGGTWKVATRTFCLRMILEYPALATAGVCARDRR